MTENRTPPSRNVRRWVWIAFLAYSAAAIGFLVFSGFSESGWLSSLLTSADAGNHPVFTGRFLAVVLIVSVWVPFVLTYWLARRFVPSLGVDLALKEIEQKLIGTGLKHPPGPATWPRIWRMTAAVFIATVLISGILLAWAVWKPAAQVVCDLDLNHGASSVSNNAKFARVRGTLATRMGLARKSRDGSWMEAFMPITEDRWTPAQPVRYMIHYEGSSLPSELKTQGETRVSGKIGGRLPTLIADRFREKGLHIEPSYVVLNWVEAGEVPSGTPAIDYDPAGIAFGVGIVMTFVTFASLALPRAAAKRSRAPKGHPSSRSTLGSRQRGRSAKCEAERQKMRPLTNYNEEVIDRLVAFERDRMQHASEEELHSAAYERLVRDNR